MRRAIRKHLGDFLAIVALFVVALGIGIDGTKHPLALVEGSTENATLVTELIVGLRRRGCGPLTTPVRRRRPRRS